MIRILDEFIADKIAAGEVIERPLSIVKELIENSIDAGSSQIVIEIKNGGKSYIRVTDNGSGIVSDEIELAFERHATGKISKLSDLDHINTLGFRGEALASITAISRLTVYSKTADSELGTKLKMQGGTTVSIEKTGMNTGTTMVVEDVFYNTPARRKFMKSDAAEATVIIDMIQKIAIYYSHIAFRLINNKQTIIATPGTGDMLTTIQSIYPSYRELIEIDGDYVHGFISDPGSTKSNKRGQIFFVNGRYISSSTIEKGIIKGYGDRIFSGHPICILFIEVNPETIDVNIHPNKKEIKFLHEEDIVKDIENAIKRVINSENTIPSAMGLRSEGTFDTKASSAVDITASNAERLSSETYQDNSLKSDEKKSTQVNIKSFLASKTRVSDITDTYTPDGLAESTQNCTDTDSVKGGFEEANHNNSASNANNNDVKINDNAKDNAIIKKQIAIKAPNVQTFDFDSLVYKGYLFDTYIIMQSTDIAYLIDQHAAHERIMYERFITVYNNSEHVSQPMLMPFSIETSSDVYAAERFWMDDLARLGFDIDDFGNNTFIVRGIPTYMDRGEAELFIHTYIEDPESRSDRGNTTVIDKLIMRSCKAAVKGNNKLSTMEIEELIKQLSNCVNPFSCPHGRPTFIRFTLSEISHAFKR
ncbi:MAG: DNA mismatch repair endonuclease MutL [Mogibacterium diversum]|jgi:DNA mismatch repair protein mutL|uniref:DNA mismatch repair endonuclease MutL n=1 Tax=Mogibacterium diversum TaxID=114527 RepID=UPI00205E4EF7|nr:DNA mismatch repair endonuclease MutL [Mogibacterium diversum]UQF82117.1 MAG: DNA mismatch repair endonuclease MutL [Mogibacterium diversum]